MTALILIQTCSIISLMLLCRCYVQESKDKLVAVDEEKKIFFYIVSQISHNYANDIAKERE